MTALIHFTQSCDSGRPDGCKQGLLLAKKLKAASLPQLRARACALGVGDDC